MNVETYIGKDRVEEVRKRVGRFLTDEEGGFIVIYTVSDNKLTDCNANVCNCCMERILGYVRGDLDLGSLTRKLDDIED